MGAFHLSQIDETQYYQIQNAEKSANRDILRAAYALYKEDYNKAKKLLNRVIELSENNPTASALLAQISFEQGSYGTGNEAHVKLHHQLSEHLDSPIAFFVEKRVELERGHFIQKNGSLRYILKSNPSADYIELMEKSAPLISRLPNYYQNSFCELLLDSILEIEWLAHDRKDLVNMFDKVFGLYSEAANFFEYFNKRELVDKLLESKVNLRLGTNIETGDKNCISTTYQAAISYLSDEFKSKVRKDRTKWDSHASFFTAECDANTIFKNIQQVDSELFSLNGEINFIEINPENIDALNQKVNTLKFKVSILEQALSGDISEIKMGDDLVEMLEKTQKNLNGLARHLDDINECFNEINELPSL